MHVHSDDMASQSTAKPVAGNTSPVRYERAVGAVLHRIQCLCLEDAGSANQVGCVMKGGGATYSDRASLRT